MSITAELSQNIFLFGPGWKELWRHFVSILRRQMPGKIVITLDLQGDAYVTNVQLLQGPQS